MRSTPARTISLALTGTQQSACAISPDMPRGLRSGRARCLGRDLLRCRPRKPCRKGALRLGATPTPPRSIVASKAAREKGSASRSRQRPEHHGADHAPGPFGDGGHVVGHERFAASGRRLEGDPDRRGHRPRAIFSVIAKTRWVEAISVVRSGVTMPRWMARAGLHQFGGDDDVDVSGHRHQRQDRRRPAACGRALGKQLEVIDRRAGALRDARHRGRFARCIHRARRDRRSSRPARRRPRRPWREWRSVIARGVSARSSLRRSCGAPARDGASCRSRALQEADHGAAHTVP